MERRAEIVERARRECIMALALELLALGKLIDVWLVLRSWRCWNAYDEVFCGEFENVGFRWGLKTSLPRKKKRKTLRIRERLLYPVPWRDQGV